MLRVTPPEGITIGETFIPGNVTISTPLYSLGRRETLFFPRRNFYSKRYADYEIVESCFEKATEFIPERWSEKPEMVRDKQVFVPFSVGKLTTLIIQFSLLITDALRPIWLCRKTTSIDGTPQRHCTHRN